MHESEQIHWILKAPCYGSKMYRAILVTATLGLLLCGQRVASQAEASTAVKKDGPSSNYTSLLDEPIVVTADNDTSEVDRKDQGNSPVSRTKRIVYGEIVNDFAYPYIVSLRVYGSHMCGGTILTPRLILTAAHCIEESYGMPTPTQVVVSAQRGKTSYPVMYRIKHPNYYKNAQGNAFNDIGVIVLQQRIENAQTVSLQSKTGNAAGNSQAQALGWGITEYGDTSQQLRKVNVPLLFPSQCQMYGPRGEWVCIDSRRSNTCSGDSGGPLMYAGRQIGITSFGANPDDSSVPCMAGVPDVFTRITSYYNWIQQQIQQYP